MIKYVFIIILLPAASVFKAFAGNEESNQTKPNILFILVDDLGWGDVGYHGSRIKTPTIDRLADEGLELDFHYAYPQCTPTRVCLMTGRYSTRYGIPRPVNMQAIPYGTETMASILKSCGYRTAIVGKWNLGSAPEWGPNHYGFDYSYGSLASSNHPYTHKSGMPGKKYHINWHRNEKLIEEEGIHTELEIKEALNWIRKSDGSKPWFLYLPFHAVHTPIDASPQFKEIYKNKKYYDDPGKQESFVRFAAMTTEVDNGIARIISLLEEKGELEKTLIVFTSDNGGVVLKNGETEGGRPDSTLTSYILSSNGKLRGQKATLYEGGIRVPTIVYWKGMLKPKKIPETCIITDWLPTFASLAGYELPPLRNLKWDGKNIWPVLTGEIQRLPERPLYFRYMHNMIALRYGDWKLIKMSDTKFARQRMPSEDRSDRLYNLSDDPYEKTDLSDQYPEIVQLLNEMIEEEMKYDMPMRDGYEAFPTLNYDIY